ncbi:MAG: hypothetical protein J5802_02400 [Butyrivibrio sp.]|nr:hypothetical protein [Butyrivibrio sp.]
MKLCNSINYRLHRYFAGSKPVFPMIIILCFIGSMYTFKPMDVISGYIISGVFVFGLMTFVTFNIGGSEEKVEEQILFLRGNSLIDYYISRELGLIVICALYSFITAIAPVFVNAMNGFNFFTRSLTVHDVVMGIILLFGSGLAGTLIGDLLNLRIMKNRKLSLMLTAMIALLTFSNDGIQQKVSYLGILKFLLPPIMTPAKIFSGADVINTGKMLIIFLQIIINYVVFTAIKIAVMNKNRFN